MVCASVERCHLEVTQKNIKYVFLHYVHIYNATLVEQKDVEHLVHANLETSCPSCVKMNLHMNIFKCY